jgi:hypothetical protein
MKFTDETKEVKEFSDNNWLGFGRHKVQIGFIEQGFTDDDPENGKEYVEVTVLGPNEEEDTARVWFTTDKAANYSFNVLRQIYVHNAPEDKKEEARATIDAVKSTEELVATLSEKLVGGECWFTKYPDPTRTYTAADGSTRPSINKNVYGYEPKERPELMPKDDQITKSNVDKIFPGSEPFPSEGATGIPKSW